MSEPRRCPATSKRTGQQCGQLLPDGATVCRWHGGGTPQALAKQEQRQVEAELVRTADRWNAGPVTDPFAALAEMAGEVLGIKNLLAGRVADLETLTATSDNGIDHVRGEMVLYERALDRAMKFLADWVRLDMDDRIVGLREKIDQRQRTNVVAAFMEATASLDSATREVVRRDFGIALRRRAA